MNGHPVVPGYEVLNLIGQGSSGWVYLARRREHPQLFALKITLARPASPTEERTQLQKRVQALARLRNPHLVQYRNAGWNDEWTYVEREFVEGTSVNQLVGDDPLPEIQVAELIRSAARGLEYLHDRGIVHGDLKPSNLLLAGSPHNVKISGFGLGRTPDGAAVPSAGEVNNSGPEPGAYRDPSRTSDPSGMGFASDQYALGVIGYQLLTGTLPVAPFLAEGMNPALPVPPSRLNPLVSSEIDRICLRCLDPDPRRRFETVGALARELDGFLDESQEGDLQPARGGAMLYKELLRHCTLVVNQETRRRDDCDADEVLDEAVYRLWFRRAIWMKSYDHSRGDFDSFVRACVRQQVLNCFRDTQRRRARMAPCEHGAEVAERGNQGPLREAVRAELAAIIWTGLETLAALDADILALWLTGLSYQELTQLPEEKRNQRILEFQATPLKEVATTLGIQLSTACRRRERAVARLRELLRARGYTSLLEETNENSAPRSGK